MPAAARTRLVTGRDSLDLNKRLPAGRSSGIVSGRGSGKANATNACRHQQNGQHQANAAQLFAQGSRRASRAAAHEPDRIGTSSFESRVMFARASRFQTAFGIHIFAHSCLALDSRHNVGGPGTTPDPPLPNTDRSPAEAISARAMDGREEGRRVSGQRLIALPHMPHERNAASIMARNTRQQRSCLYQGAAERRSSTPMSDLGSRPGSGLSPKTMAGAPSVPAPPAQFPLYRVQE